MAMLEQAVAAADDWTNPNVCKSDSAQCQQNLQNVSEGVIIVVWMKNTANCQCFQAGDMHAFGRDSAPLFAQSIDNLFASLRLVNCWKACDKCQSQLIKHFKFHDKNVLLCEGQRCMAYCTPVVQGADNFVAELSLKRSEKVQHATEMGSTGDHFSLHDDFFAFLDLA